MANSASDTSMTRPHNILIEGWRGISHSFALVNQSQILELLKIGDVRLFHRDLPFAFGHWKRERENAGFPAIDQARIDALAEPQGEMIDTVYRAGFPFGASTGDHRRKTITFMVTEMGLLPSLFTAGQTDPQLFTRGDDLVVTPSNWSRERILEYGFPADKVRVLPHGVNPTVFHPLSDEERRLNRGNLGIRDEETVFLNLGSPTWNKGLDVLLRAFATLRRNGRLVRLILKEQKNLYGITVEATVRKAAVANPELFTADVIGSISVVPGTFDLAQLRLLYGVADCYVSPYRAEGFNLPVLEAIACGTPVITTAGGATDDFCTDDVALRIAGDAADQGITERGGPGRYIEPRPGDLVAAMDSVVRGDGFDRKRLLAGRERVLQDFSWKRAAHDLVTLATGRAPKTAADLSAAPSAGKAVRSPQQRVIDLMTMIRPRATVRTGKVRVGNAYDGGYVLPAVALEADLVLSIGVGPDVSFDKVLADRGAKILQFDHTVEKSPTEHPNFTFYKKGWGPRSEGEFLSLADMNETLSEMGAKRPLLKFDIEGGEYEVLQSVDPDDLARFEVIVCEIHDLDGLTDPAFFERVRSSFAKLTHHHVPVHLHANNYQGVVLTGGVPIPKVLEISFLRRDMDEFPGFATDPIPGALDRPNHPFKPDIVMNPFGSPRARSMYIYCDGGFGNRYNALISGLALAQSSGLEPIVVWPKNNWCGAAYEDLFERPLRVIDRELATFQAEKDRLHFFMVEDHLRMGVPNRHPMTVTSKAEAVRYVSEQLQDVFYYTALIPPFISTDEVRAQIIENPIRSDLVARAQAFIEDRQLDDFYGVHIRATDFGARSADSEGLYDLVGKYGNRRFFVCSDDEEVERRFEKKSNVVIYDKSAYVEKFVEGGWNTEVTDRSGRRYPFNITRSAQSVQDALVDLLILSKSKIIKTSDSTFLNTAHLLQQASAAPSPA